MKAEISVGLGLQKKEESFDFTWRLCRMFHLFSLFKPNVHKREHMESKVIINKVIQTQAD